MPDGRQIATSRGALGRSLLTLVRACHPEPVAAVTLLTCFLALAAGLGWRTLLLGVAVGVGQLGVGWSNDYLDRELDRRSGRGDKPLAADPAAPGLVRAAAIVAFVAVVPLSLAVSLGFAAAHFAGLGCALAYNLWLKGGPASVVPYALAFGLVPVGVAMSVSAAAQPHWPPAWAVAAGALIGAGGHFTQALPDIPADRRLGVRGLPQVIGQTASACAAAGLLLAANLTVALAADGGVRALQAAHVALATALTAGIVAAATVARRPRAAFRLTLASAGVAVLAFLAGGSRL